METNPRPATSDNAGSFAEARIPLLSAALGYAAVLPFVLGAAAAWSADDLVGPAVRLTVLWGAVLLVFLGGVWRGLSFRTPGGPTPVQVIMALWLFGLGLAALLAPIPVVSIPILFVGFATVALVDPLAALRAQVPRFFARLRPPQAGVAGIAFVALLIRIVSD